MNQKVEENEWGLFAIIQRQTRAAHPAGDSWRRGRAKRASKFTGVEHGRESIQPRQTRAAHLRGVGSRETGKRSKLANGSHAGELLQNLRQERHALFYNCCAALSKNRGNRLPHSCMDSMQLFFLSKRVWIKYYLEGGSITELKLVASATSVCVCACMRG